MAPCVDWFGVRVRSVAVHKEQCRWVFYVCVTSVLRLLRQKQSAKAFQLFSKHFNKRVTVNGFLVGAVNLFQLHGFNVI